MKPHDLILALLSASPVAAQGLAFQPLREGLPRMAPLYDLGVGDYTGLARDFDGDGIRDLLVVGLPEGEVGPDATYLLRGSDRAGSLLAPAWEQVLQVPLAGAVALDIDMDRDFDLVAGNVVALNDGHAKFTLVTNRIPPQIGGDPMFADVDGDGDPDGVRTDPINLQLLVNDGQGFFSIQTGAIDPINGRIAAWCDVESDGDPDLLVTNFLSGKIRTLVNDGRGTFALSDRIIRTDTGGPTDVADLDGDGDQDFVARGRYGYVLYENDGLGNFQFAGPLPFQGYNGLVDVDGDGLDDFLVPWVVGAQLADQLLRNLGGFQFASPTPLPGALGNFVLPLDADSDGDSDLVHVGSDLRLWLNGGDGDFVDVTHQERWRGTTIRDAVLGDMDLDADLDLIVTDGVSLGALLNDGTGRFVAGHLERTLVPKTRIVVLDADDDGDLDVVQYDATTFGSNRSSFELFENDGTGALTWLPGRLPKPSSAKLARADDLTGDGVDDLVVLTHTNGIVLLANDGTGNFVGGRARGTSGAMPLNFGLGDVDGDGDVDVVVSDSSPGQKNVLFSNDGTGMLSKSALSLPAPARMPFGFVVMLDMENDGDLDLAFGGGLLYENDGSGSFTDVSSRWTRTTPPTQGLLTLDVEGDGDTDLASPSGSLWLNDGSGSFSEVNGVLPSPFSVLAAGDVDGDDDADLILSDECRVLFNTANQLAWRVLPRVGQPLVLDLYGEPTRGYRLFGSPRRSLVPTPAGTVYLDLTQLLSLGGGTTDLQGRATRALPIPPDPTLVGRELFLQALWTGARPDLTNLEGGQITAY